MKNTRLRVTSLRQFKKQYLIIKNENPINQGFFTLEGSKNQSVVIQFNIEITTLRVYLFRKCKKVPKWVLVYSYPITIPCVQRDP